jgi:hypothetical protein
MGIGGARLASWLPPCPGWAPDSTPVFLRHETYAHVRRMGAAANQHISKTWNSAREVLESDQIGE